MSHVEMRGRLNVSPTTVRQTIQRAAKPAMREAILTVEAEWKHRAARARRTGTYLRSIAHAITYQSNTIVGVVGTNLDYARYLEDGTGLYGPRNRWIVPRAGNVLAWPAAVGQGTPHTLAGRPRSGASASSVRSNMVFARRVRGIRPRRFARDAALVALPRVEAIFRASAVVVGRELLEVSVRP